MSSPLRKAPGYTDAQVKLLMNGKKRDLATKDEEIARLRVENERLVAQYNAVAWQTTVNVVFRPNTPFRRIRAEGVNTLLIRQETMERSMWDFAERAGKYFDYLSFTLNGQQLSRASTIAGLGLKDGDVVDVAFVGDKAARQAQPEVD